MTRNFGAMTRCMLALLIAVIVPTAAMADGGAQHQVVQARPIQLGTSGGNINDVSIRYCCSGTLGSLVQDGAGTQYILSNNHVLARSNYGQVGDPVNQPGMVDQSCQTAGGVAALATFVPLQFSTKKTIIWNTVDAAIAQTLPGMVATDGSILDIGPISNNTISTFVGQAVQKSGRTTGQTTGSVLAIDVTSTVGYSQSCGGSANQIAYFKNQIRIGGSTFSGAGDSGSLVVESGATDPVNGRPRAVGLLFAGDNTSTIANPIANVLSALGVSMVGGAPLPPPAHGSVAGVVTNASTNATIAGATVAVGTLSTTTDSAGAYVLENVPIGTQTVTASASGYASASKSNVVVNENEITVADFQLAVAVLPTTVSPGCVIYNTTKAARNTNNLQITIKVVNDFGQPVSGATVNISLKRNGSSYATGTGATTNSSGLVTYVAQRAPNGTYVTTVTNIVASGLSFLGSNSTPPNSFNLGVDAVPADFCAAGVTASGAVGNGKVQTMARARAANARNSDKLMGLEGVVGHGVGVGADGKPFIEVYVLKSAKSSARAAVPADVDGVAVRVVPTDGFVAY